MTRGAALSPGNREVWILNHYAQEPGGNIGRTGHYSIAKYIADHGWNASIVAASVEHNSGRQRLASNEAVRLETFDGVRFLWLRTPTYEGNGLRRIANMATFTARALAPDALGSLARPDVIIGTTVHPFAAWAGCRLAIRHRVPFIYEVRDLWPQTLIDMGRLVPGSVTTRLFQRLERYLYRKAAHVLVLPPRAPDYIVPLGVPAERITWLPNGVDLADFPLGPIPSDDRATFDLLYFGAHGTANGLESVIRAMALLAERPLRKQVRLRLIGDGPLKPALQSLVQGLSLGSVSFEESVPRSSIPSLAAQADAFVFNLIDLPVFRYGISSNKLFDFLAGGRPILFCCNSANNPIDEAGCGITVPPGDPLALANAIAELVSLPVASREMMGKNARTYVEKHHDYRNLAARLATVLDAVAGQVRSDQATSTGIRYERIASPSEGFPGS